MHVKICVCIQIALLSLFQTSAFALPGWTATQIRTWANNHTFLAPAVQDLDAGTIRNLFIRRKLEDNKQLLVRYYSGMGGPFTRTVLSVNDVTQQFIGSEESMPNLWDRKSDKAFLLIEKTYGTNLAQDFKSAQFVFKAVDIGWENHSSFRDKNTLDDQYNEMWEEEEVQFFKGKMYGYEINASRSSLTLMSLADLNEQISIIQHNRNKYQRFLKRQNRDKPANIKL